MKKYCEVCLEKKCMCKNKKSYKKSKKSKKGSKKMRMGKRARKFLSRRFRSRFGSDDTPLPNAVSAPFFGSDLPFAVPSSWYFPVTNNTYQFPQHLVNP
jgi:hypothetical protein